MEVVEPVLQKKYHKIRSLSRGNSLTSMTDSLPPMSSAPTTSRATTITQSKMNDDWLLSKSLSNRTETTAQKMEATSSSMSSPMGINSSQLQRKVLPTLQQQAQLVLQQNRNRYPPLNLADSTSGSGSQDRKRPLSTASASSMASMASMSSSVSMPLHIDTSLPQENLHPQNPERSIIKSLLLNSRGLAVPTTGEGEDAVYTCPLCKITFRSADNLQYHTKCYCQGTPPTSQQQQQLQQHQRNNSPQSAPISPVGSPSHKYFRSNSFNLCLPEKYSPNTLAKLASSSLRHPHRTPLSLAKLAAQQANPHLPKTSSSMTPSSTVSSSGRLRPDNIIINTSTCPAPAPLNLPSSMPQPSSSMSVSSQCVQITKQLIDAALPSPGPLLGKTRLVDTYSAGLLSDFSKFDGSHLGLSHSFGTRSISPSSVKSSFGSKHDSVSITPINNHFDDGPLIKRARLNKYPPLPFSTASTSSFGMKDQIKPSRLQMCGGAIKIVPKTEETQPRFGLSGGSIINISPPSESSPMNIRTGLNSGGSVIETPKRSLSPNTPADFSSSKSSHNNIGTPQTSNSFMSSSTGLRSNNAMNFFQFPPINSISGYNPLTLPPHSTSMNPIEPTKIYHGGKFIPFVQGIPGPNTTMASTPMMSVYRNEFPMPQTMMSGGRGRSPSPSRKKIIPNSPIAIRAVPTSTPLQSPSSNPRFSPFNKGYLSPSSSLLSTPSASPRGRSFTKLSPVPSEDDIQRATPSAFTGIINNSFSTSNHFGIPSSWNPNPVLSKPQDINPSASSSKKTFNFTRIADNLSPLKSAQPSALPSKGTTETNAEVRHFNFENLIPKPDAILRAKQEPLSLAITSPLHIDVSSTITSTSVSTSPSVPTLVLPPLENSINKDNGDDSMLKPPTTTSKKFLRPTSLPLKPGTFTPKCHHGITPTANTLPLISPETPRPSKNCVQLYLNGHAYTYLGLKCSTKPFYCTVSRPQPSHFTNQPKLSIYSNWQVCAEKNPIGLTAKEALSLYDSRQRLQQYRRNGKCVVAKHTSSCTTLQSQMIISSPFDSRIEKTVTVEANLLKQQPHSASTFVPFDSSIEEKKPTTSDLLAATDDKSNVKITLVSPKQEPNLSGGEDLSNQKFSDSSQSPAPTMANSVNVVPPAVPGGYESNEDYTYVRGRGRGRYVCSECGIRCKKPSMLKKHIRTHTDVRPFTCQHCSFR